ncbi:MAG: hypothetical protein HY856_18560 [Burkholderiales bacterium]|jgi:hypothetical protein|nr:hypothetical protein [Burkholderiales bacterium]
MTVAQPPARSIVHLCAAGLAAAVLCATPARAGQPHMEEALAHLQQARAALMRASSDKGGNRADALRAVDKAIAEVQRGMAYDQRHQSFKESVRR